MTTTVLYRLIFDDFVTLCAALAVTGIKYVV